MSQLAPIIWTIFDQTPPKQNLNLAKFRDKGANTFDFRFFFREKLGHGAEVGYLFGRPFRSVDRGSVRSEALGAIPPRGPGGIRAPGGIGTGGSRLPRLGSEM